MRAAEIDPHHRFEVLGIGGQSRARSDLRGIRDQDLDGTEGLCGILDKLQNGIWLAQIQREGGRLTSAAANGVGHFVARLNSTGSEDDGVTGRGQCLGRGGADTRRGPGDHRRPATRVLLETCHQRRVTVVGNAASPRTLMECTRSRPAGSTS